MRCDTGQPKVGRCQHFSHELGKKKKKGLSATDREVQVRDTAAEKDIMVDRRGDTSIRVSCDASPLHPFQGEKKMGTVADEWPRSQEENRTELAPRD